MSALAGKSEAELVRLEREIARGHIDKFPYFAVAWAFTNLAVWLSLWPLVLLGILPLWAGFLIASFNVAACYLPSHEAQHDIIAKPGTRLRWLNQLVGHLSTLPLVLPYRVARLTHLEHHTHANDPALDPDHSTQANGPLHAIWTSIQNRQPGAKGGFNSYAETLKRIGRAGGRVAGRGGLQSRVLRRPDGARLERVCYRGGAALVVATACRDDLYPLLSELGAASSGYGQRPLPRYPQLPGDLRQYRLDGDAVSHCPSSASAHPTLQDADGLLADEGHSRGARVPDRRALTQGD